MKVAVAAVGRPKGPIGEAIAEYEARAGRYFNLTAADVKEETARGSGDSERVKNAEGERLLARAASGTELVALHRGGDAWTSGRFARYLDDLRLHGGGATFLIGGAYGLSASLLDSVRHRVSLSACTLPHDLARLVLAEQLYRAGTILRGEPYHKGLAA